MSKSAAQTAQPAAKAMAPRQGVLQRKCDCGNHTVAGGQCEECGKKKTPLQRLAFNPARDAFEDEADRIADRLLAAPAYAVPRTVAPRIQRFTAGGAGTALAAPPSVERVLAGSGRSMDPEVRGDMEKRFGRDFSHVRVHSGSAAAQSARDVSAHAYTVGNHIVFGEGAYTPSTQDGRKLIAHELTHVVQQSSDAVGRSVQAKPAARPAASVRTARSFRIRVDHPMDADELLFEFVKQYYGYLDDAEIRSRLSWWSMGEPRGTNPGEVQRGYVVASVSENFQTRFETLDEGAQAAVNAATDQRFWERTGYKPGQKLGSSADDKRMAQVWMGVRNAVLTEDKQRKVLLALPEDVKNVMFAGGVDAPTLRPEDYTQALRIAEKLRRLSPEALRDYAERVNASTTSLNAFESSVNSYVRLQAERGKQAADTERASGKLLGAEGVYDKYLEYRGHKAAAAFLNAQDDMVIAALRAEEDARVAEAELIPMLKHKDFSSIEDFESALEAYRVAFRTQTVNIALDVLARYDHMLHAEQTKFAQPGVVEALVQSIAATSAKAKYAEARAQRAEARTLRQFHEPKETWWIAPAREADKAAAAATAGAEAEVLRASADHPLIAERKIDREKLAGLDVDGARKYLVTTIAERRRDVETSRREFVSDPDKVFKLPDLLAANQQLQGIDETSIYGRVIRDYIQAEKNRHVLSAIVTGAIALALAFLVPGGGWLAAAALVANAAISTHAAYTAYNEYQRDTRDYTLGFLSQEPSFIWVGVAIAAAALDLGLAATELIKVSSTALKSLEGPIREFAMDRDVAKLTAKIDAAEGLKVELKAAMKREAEQVAAAKSAWSDLGGRTYVFLPGVGDPGLLRQGFRALYAEVRRGVSTIARLRADAKYIEALGDITRMSGAEREALETAFEEVKTIVKAGEAKSMNDDALLGFIDRWATNRGKPGFQEKLLDEMKVWKPLTADQEQALSALRRQRQTVDALYADERAAAERVAELRKQTARDADDIAELRELESRLTHLDPVKYPPKGAPRRSGAIRDAEVTLAARETEAARAQVSLYDRLRAATPSAEARARTMRGVHVDQVGPLKTPPGALETEHIVSVREISDMDGFRDLLWKEQKAVADLPENLVAMDKSANASKLDRTWRSWRQADRFYDENTITTMVKREADARAAIEAEIQKRLAARGAGTR